MKKKFSIILFFIILFIGNIAGAGYTENFDSYSNGAILPNGFFTTDSAIDTKGFVDNEHSLTGSQSYTFDDGTNGEDIGHIVTYNFSDNKTVEQPFTFYSAYYETSSGVGGGLIIYDRSGQVVAGWVTDNPGFHVFDDSESDDWTGSLGNGGYDDWHNITMELHGDGTYTVSDDGSTVGTFETGSTNAVRGWGFDNQNGAPGSTQYGQITLDDGGAYIDIWYDAVYTSKAPSSPNTAPSVDSISTEPTNIQTNDQVNVSYSVSDSDGNIDSVLTEVFNESGSKIAEDSQNFATPSTSQTLTNFFTPSSAQNYTIYVTATDDAGASTVDTLEKNVTQAPTNEPPQINSTSVNPDTPNVNEFVTYSAEVFDPEGSWVETCLTVKFGGSEVVNNECRNSTTASWTDIYKPDSGNTFLNATFNASDNESAYATSELNRYLEDVNPSVSILEPESVTYQGDSAPYNVDLNKDNDDVPNEQSYVTGYVDGNLQFNETVTEGNNVSGTLTGLSESDHTFEVNATELNNGATSNTESVTFTSSIDRPTVNIFNPESTTYDTGSVPLDVTGSDSSSSITSYCYKLDGSNCVDFTPNTTINPSEGDHDLKVFAFDEVGNNGSATVSFEVDQYKIALKEPVEAFNYTSGLDSTAYFEYNVSAYNKTAWLYYNNNPIAKDYIDLTGWIPLSAQVSIYNIGRQNWSVQIKNVSKTNKSESNYVQNITDIIPQIDGENMFDHTIAYSERFDKNGWIENDGTDEVFDTDIYDGNYHEVNFGSNQGSIDGTDAIYFQNDGTKATTANYNLYGNQTANNQIEFDLVIKDEITDQFNVRPQYRDSNGDITRLAYIRFRGGDVEVQDDAGDGFNTIATDFYTVGEYMNIEITTDFEDNRIFIDNGTQDLGTGYVDYSENVDRLNGAGFSMFSNNVDNLYNIILMDDLEFDNVNQSYTETVYNVNYYGDNSTIDEETSFFNVEKNPTAIGLTLFRPTANYVRNGERVGFSGLHSVSSFINSGNTSIQYRNEFDENWTSLDNYSFVGGQEHVAIGDTITVNEGSFTTITIDGDEHTIEVPRMNYTGEDLGIKYDYERRVDGLSSNSQFFDVFFIDGVAFAGYRTQDNDSDIYDSVTFAQIPQTNLSRGNYEKRAVSWADNGAVYFSDVTEFATVSNNDVEFVDSTDKYIFEPERPDQGRVFSIQAGTEFNIGFEFIHELKNNISGVRTLQIVYNNDIIFNRTLSSTTENFEIDVDRDWDIGTYQWRVRTYSDENGTFTSEEVEYSVGSEQGEFNLFVSFVKPVSEWIGLSPSQTRVIFTLLFVGIMYLALRIPLTIGVNNSVGNIAGLIAAVITYMFTVYIKLPTRAFHLFVIFITIAFLAYKWWSN